MIACVSPAYSSANHTINTLRYSDRLKEKTKQNANQNQNVNLIINNNMNNMNNVVNNSNFNNNINIGNQPRKGGVNNNPNLDFNNIREVDFDINMEVLINIIFKIDDNVDDDKFLNPEVAPGDEWDYLKKTAQAKDGKYLSDEFIKYHQITEKIIEDEDEILNTHMLVIKVNIIYFNNLTLYTGRC